MYRVFICAFKIQALEVNTQIHNMLDLRIESKKPLFDQYKLAYKQLNKLSKLNIKERI